MDFDASSVCFFREPAEEVAEAAVEQRLEIPLLRAVGVELQEEIVADGWSQIEPLAHPRGRTACRNRRSLRSPAAAAAVRRSAGRAAR